MRELLDVNRVQAGIAREHLPARTRGGIALEDAVDVGFELAEHEAILGVSD